MIALPSQPIHRSAEGLRHVGSRAFGHDVDFHSVQTLDVEDIPIADLPGNARRVRVRVVGEIARLAAEGASF